MKSSRKQNNVVLKNKSKFHFKEEKHSCIINKALLLLFKKNYASVHLIFIQYHNK